jgi:Right handed beta helix region
MSRFRLGVIIAAGCGLAGVLVVVSAPAGSQTPCELALAEAAELEALLNHNNPTSRRQQKLEADQRAFISQVRARCALSATTTTAPTPTTEPRPTTTTVAESTTTTAPGQACLPDPSACGYPDAETTGPTGALTPVDVGCGDYLVSQDGAVVQNLDIHGTLWVSGNNVTIRNVRVRTTCNWIAVGLEGRGITFEDSEVDGTATTGYGVGVGDGAVVRRNEIHSVTDGMSSNRSNWTAADNWIHDLADTSGQGHFDGIQFDGGQADIDIVHNTMSIPADTGAVNIANNDGPVRDVLVLDNLLAGGTFTVYVDDQFGPGPITDITVKNNRFGWHTYGYWMVRHPTPSIVFSGNVDDTTGEPI